MLYQVDSPFEFKVVFGAHLKVEGRQPPTNGRFQTKLTDFLSTAGIIEGWLITPLVGNC